MTTAMPDKCPQCNAGWSHREAILEGVVTVFQCETSLLEHLGGIHESTDCLRRQNTALRDTLSDIRDAVLYEFGPYDGFDNDQINAVLALIDEHWPQGGARRCTRTGADDHSHSRRLQRVDARTFERRGFATVVARGEGTREISKGANYRPWLLSGRWPAVG